jgi:hypothetical protein
MLPIVFGLLLMLSKTVKNLSTAILYKKKRCQTQSYGLTIVVIILLT